MRSILIVARTAPWRDALVARLEQEGYVVTTASDAEQARAAMAAAVPGATLVDCDLPRKSIRRLLGWLERDPRLQGIRRLFVGAPDPEACPQSGPVFDKPVDVGHVARALRALYPDPERRAGIPRPRLRPGQLDLAIQAALAV
jgi:CheY-like chemotaxis protein